MLRVSFSNRFEALLEALLDALADPPSSPFASQQVIVPSVAIRRKIELAAAERFGICANVDFSFLGAWLWRQIGRLVPVAEASPFTPAILAWRIFEILDDRAFVDAHARLRAYLREADPLMRCELALRTASLFDEYITYRADWLAAWSDGRAVGDVERAGAEAAADERWQAAMWRRIAGDLGARRRHPAAEFLDVIAAQGRDTLDRIGIRDTVHVFCLPSIAPLYLHMLRQLSRFVDVHVSALNPCREYWFDTIDRRRLSYLAAQGTLDYHEVGNPLLASWGKQRKAQLALLLDNDDAQLDDDRFERSRGKSILAHVQNTILELRDLSPGSVADAASDDRSVEVHVCHSLTRELEVLHDYLLALFAGRNPPRPSDILVVTPALDAAAPLIDAVFGTASGKRHVPYSITGRRRSRVNHAARALLDLLAVAVSRFPASAVTELLQQPIVARRFDIDAAALERIRGWIRVAGVRWGIDARHREQCGVPAVSQYTFDDGLQRLYLGYALPSVRDAAASAPFDDRLPAGDAQGNDALALGCLSRFVRALEQLRREVMQPKRASEWMQALLDVTATFLASDYEETEDLRDVQAAIGELAAAMDAGGVRANLPLDVVRAALESVLDDPARGGVPGGAVTFGAMASLRDLPYRVICVIGMDDGAWPRTASTVEFDLMAAVPRAGDRQRRDDDRNVFLDLLLAARERFYVSYAGRSIRDNTSLPPSVLVSELVDNVIPAVAPSDADAEALAVARRRLVVEHPLQPFSVDAFTGDDPRQRSFAAEYCEALRQQLRAIARASAHDTTTNPAATRGMSAPMDVLADELLDEDEVLEPLAPFFTAPLAPAGDEWRSVTLDQLRRFFRYPCSYLLGARLGLRLEDVDEELLDDEPFIADTAARAALADRLLPLYLNGTSRDAIRERARAGTEYPPGSLGQRLLDRELAHLDAFARDLAPALAMPCVPPVDGIVDFVLHGEAWQLSGAFGDLRADGLLRYRYSDTRPVDYLDGWLSHIFLNVLAPPGVALVTRWHSRDGQFVLQPLADPVAQAQTLLGLYRRGLCAPLHFFARSAWEYAKHDRDLGSAAKEWLGHPWRRGEKEYESYRLALRGVVDPLDAEFEECAQAVFEPLLASIVDPRLE
ncbi:MAG TPA: exodeoxyribonuclease V subunit gamma [Casimicrobiaceae bacterium]|nr:exodeoxyribonuclease V subunit gamma [Casimicrobiaceae bacterium]